MNRYGMYTFVCMALVLCIHIANSEKVANRTQSPINLNEFTWKSTYSKFCQVSDKNNNDFRTKWDRIPKLFMPNKNASAECLQDTNRLFLGAENLEMWALKMIDSSAKLPSGILNGNVNQYGDYDQCLSISEPIRGKYCLATFHLNMLKQYDDVDLLIHSHHWSKNNLTDIAHRVPKVSTIHWGICLPASCSAEDLQAEMMESLKIFNGEVYVDPNLCVTRNESKNYSRGKIITIAIFSIIIISIILGTMCHDEENRQNGNMTLEFLKSFSLKKNFKQLTNFKSDNKVRGLDGIRGLNAIGLLLSHKSISLFFSPFVNRTHMSRVYTLSWSVIGRTAILYTDSFLLISGFLSATNFLDDIKNYGKINFSQRFINRLFRILPNLIAVILFSTYILPDLGDGPQWGIVIEEHSRLCKMNMWKNLLFIHNYMGFENMCLTHTHHLGIDMQLFLATPILVFILWRLKNKGVIVLLLVAILSTVLRFWIAMKKNLSMVVYNSMPVYRYFDSANYSYILPTHRATIYSMGIAMAYFRRKNIYISKARPIVRRASLRIQNQKIKFQFGACIGWTLGVSMALLAAVGPMHMAVSNYRYDPLEAAYYSALAPIIWGAFISWGMWACDNEAAGWFGKFMEWRGFALFSKLSYAVYLMQFPIFFYSVGVQRHADYFTIFKMLNFMEFAFVLAASAALVLIVEMPFNNIHNLLFGKIVKPKEEKRIKLELNNNVK